MPEPTVPVPIPDLLAAIDDVHDAIYCLEAGDLFIVNEDGEPMDFAKQQEWANALLLIVRSVPDLAARVETLTEYVEANETLSGARRRTSNAEWRAALDDFQAARRALLEEAK